jgi:hypothetical protein
LKNTAGFPSAPTLLCVAACGVEDEDEEEEDDEEEDDEEEEDEDEEEEDDGCAMDSIRCAIILPESFFFSIKKIHSKENTLRLFHTKHSKRKYVFTSKQVPIVCRMTRHTYVLRFDEGARKQFNRTYSVPGIIYQEPT